MVAWNTESVLGLSRASSAATLAAWLDKHGAAGATSGAVEVAGGRNGGDALRANSGTTWNFVFDSTATAYVQGAHLVTPVQAGEFLSLGDATVTHITVAANVDGSLDIRRGTIGGTTLVSTAAGVLAPGTFSHWELKATIADSGGVVELKKNGTVVATFTGDTRNGGTAACTKGGYWHLATQVGANTSRWTDMVYGALGAYWGDARVELIKPSGAGNSTVLTRGGADSGANWSQVDEAVANDDTDYVTSGTPGDKDTYAHENLVSTGGTVQGINIVARMRKDDAGARSVKNVGRLSGTEEDGPALTLATTYGTFTDPRTTKPGGGAFSIADVNNSEWGPKINA